MPSTTANWHWKNKNVTSWAKEWFECELTAISVSGEGSENVVISSVTEVDGDVELGQRKSKYVPSTLGDLILRPNGRFDGAFLRLITIYDLKVQLKWTGTASDGTEVEGSLTIPEVSHEITLDGLSDYVVSPDRINV